MDQPDEQWLKHPRCRRTARYRRAGRHPRVGAAINGRGRWQPGAAPATSTASRSELYPDYSSPASTLCGAWRFGTTRNSRAPVLIEVTSHAGARAVDAELLRREVVCRNRRRRRSRWRKGSQPSRTRSLVFGREQCTAQRGTSAGHPPRTATRSTGRARLADVEVVLMGRREVGRVRRHGVTETERGGDVPLFVVGDVDRLFELGEPGVERSAWLEERAIIETVGDWALDMARAAGGVR